MAPSILLIEGMSDTGIDWYADSICGTQSLSNTRINRVSFKYGENASQVRSEIESYKHSSIIVCDLSEGQDTFTRLLGRVLQKFVSTGGHVAFTTTESQGLEHMLQVLFNVPWKASSYCRATWNAYESCADTLEEFFPVRALDKHAMNISFTSSACTFSNVPPSDRCFTMLPKSRNLEYVLPDSGNAVSKGKSVSEECEVAGEDTEVCVAVRRFELGAVAYFGDVNCEDTTARLIAAFCLANDPEMPRQLPAVARRMKERANEAFRQKRYEDADALFEGVSELIGTDEDLCVEHSKILGNVAECRLERGRWKSALEAADKAVLLDEENVAARFGRVRALVMRGQEEIQALRDRFGADVNELGKVFDRLVCHASGDTVCAAAVEDGNLTFI